MKLPYCRQVEFVKVRRAFFTLDEYYRLIKELAIGRADPGAGFSEDEVGLGHDDDRRRP